MLNTLTGITYDSGNANNITGVQYAQTPCTGGTTSQDESSEDWWYGHVNVYDANHNLIGYAAYGYSDLPNWSGDFGCKQFPMADIAPRDMDTWARRRSVPFAMVSLFDPSGHMIWCGTPFIPGVFYGITQAGDGGDIVCIGEATVNRTNPSPSLSMPVHYDPVVGNPGPDISQGCESGDFAIKACIAAFALDGTPQWVNMYGATGSPQQAWSTFARGENIAPVFINGQASLIAVGYGRANPTDAGNSGMVLRLNLNGELIDPPSFYGPGTPGMGTMGIEPDETVWMQSVNVATDGANVQHAVITGAHFEWDGQWTTPTDGSAPQKIFTPESYLIWLTPDDAQPYAPDEVVNTRSGSYLQASHTAALGQYSTSAKFVHEGSVLNVLWPVMSNYTGPITAGAKSATLKIHKYAMDGTPLWSAPVNMGEVRAYDLQADVCPLSDGANFAVLSSRYTPPFDASNVMNYNDDLTPLQKACLTDNFSYDADPGTAVNSVDWSANWIHDFGFWNTDAVVGKLRISDGQQLWQKQFDAEDGAPPECFPGDLKNQECMYRITEAPDGGLVVSGNTSHNQDDAYLAKLYPDCQSMVDYAAIDALLDPNTHEYHVTGATTWNADMNVHGQVIVDQGATLTINNGATISFADSKQLDEVTRLIVEPGGKLYVNGGATLTSIGQCPGSVWDGVQVHGNFFAVQDPILNSAQGVAMLSNATIENARAGILLANSPVPGDFDGRIIKESTGGIVQATQVQFKNNRYDVDFRRYENHILNHPDQVANNRSYFTQCSFTVDAGLNDGSMPRDHVYMGGVRGIGFNGCSFAGTTYYDLENGIVSDAGFGVDAVNSSFQIGSKCTVILPVGGTCPDNSLIKTTFDQLSLGVKAASFDPGKTFSVDQAVFMNCPRSIRMDGVANASVTRNNIDVVDFTAQNIVTSPYGIYSDQCTGYEIEDNAFTTHYPHTPHAGLVIKDSGPEANRFYNNTFDGFDYLNSTAALIEGQNADPNADYLVGLQVKCNDFGQHGAQNAYDVALTGTSPSLRGNQGGYNGPTDYTAPAGNRFSLLHQPESDWHVANSSNYVTYFHHDGNPAAIPQDHDPEYLLLTNTGVHWQTERSLECPDNQRSQLLQRSALQLLSATDDGLLQDSKDAYDATKDDGDTYTLLGYVQDPGHSDMQVRNALQSVAPKVSTEVWKAVFARDPAMDPWYLTQALLSNSPLQPEVMEICYNSDLDDFYYDLIAEAQGGEVNLLSRMESEISTYAGGKAEALTDMARWCWLDTAGVDSAITLLMAWQDSVKADNAPSMEAGYYMAKADTSALLALAEDELDHSGTPDVFELLKFYASAEQAEGWDKPDSSTLQWLNDLAGERWTIGSAQASAWLQALGSEPLDEVIILPVEQRSATVRRQRHAVSDKPMLLQAYPNPSTGPVYVVCNVPQSVAKASLWIMDLNGRLIHEQPLAAGEGIAELQPGMAAPGIYLAELHLDGIRAGQVKLALQ